MHGVTSSINTGGVILTPSVFAVYNNSIPIPHIKAVLVQCFYSELSNVIVTSWSARPSMRYKINWGPVPEFKSRFVCIMHDLVPGKNKVFVPRV